MLKLFCPDMYIQSIYFLKPEDLANRGIKGIIVDLDNTLVPWNVEEPDNKLISWFKGFDKRGIKMCIVSNNKKNRVKSFANELSIPFIHKAVKPQKKAFLKGIKLLGTEISNTAVIGDQILTDILGGNRLGFYTVLVIPVSSKELWWTRLMRKVERVIINILIKKGLLKKPL